MRIPALGLRTAPDAGATTPEKPPAWIHIDPVTQAVGLARIARIAADCVGLFSLFALTVVFSNIAGAKHLTWEVTHFLTWEGDARLHVPWLPFLLFGAFGVWVFNRHGLRIALALEGGWRWPWQKPRKVEDPTPWTKAAVVLALVAFSALVVVTATKFQDTGREVDARAAQIVEQRGQRARGAVQAELDNVIGDLETLTQPRDDTPNYQTQAARAGAVSWAARVAAIRQTNPAFADRLAAEAPTADRGDGLRAKREALNAELAAAPVEAEQATTIDVDRGVTGFVTDWFKAVPLWFAIATEFLALIMKLVEVVLLRRAQHAFARAQAAAQPTTQAGTQQGPPAPPPAPPAPPPPPPATPPAAPPDTPPDSGRKPRKLKTLRPPTAAELAAWSGQSSQATTDPVQFDPVH